MQLLYMSINVFSWCCWYVRMDDDSCVMKLIEIVPVDDYINRLESSGVKLSPCHVKVCMLFTLCFFIVNYMICLSVVKLLNSREISFPSLVRQSRNSNETRFGPSIYSCLTKSQYHQRRVTAAVAWYTDLFTSLSGHQSSTWRPSTGACSVLFWFLSPFVRLQ